MKKSIALAVAVAMAAAVGCGATETKADTPKRFAQTSGQRMNAEFMMTFVDKKTGVEYLWIDGNKAGGITVLLNPDGTPKIAKGY